jgi:hypothetical protein
VAGIEHHSGHEYNSGAGKRYPIDDFCDFFPADGCPSPDPGFHSLPGVEVKQETEQAEQINYPQDTAVHSLFLISFNVM